MSDWSSDVCSSDLFYVAVEKSTITCYLKPSKCKMEIQSIAQTGSATYTLYFDDQKSDVIMMSSGTKTIIPITSLSLNKHLQNIWYAAETGKTQNIAGYESKEVQLKTMTSVIQCFVATEFNAQFPLVLNTSAIMQSIQSIKLTGTPVSIIVNDLTGKPLFTQKIVSVNPQNLNDNIFIAE